MKKAAIALLLAAIGLLMLACFTSKDNKAKIDKTIVRMADLTHDGIPDKVIMHITGNSIRSPFIWTIEIYSQDKRIFYKKRDDSIIDAAFNDPKFVGDCASYEACKEKWYFKDMMDVFLYPLDPSFSDILQANVSWAHSYDEVQRMILKAGKANLNEAQEIIEGLKKQIKSGKAIAISLEVNPASEGPIGLWIPIANDFMRIIN
jgi:hypothetical protein